MRLLLIEDEPNLSHTLSRALREESYVVDTAEDGESGLYHAMNWDYDVIILDIMLPKLNGWQVLEALRQTKQTPVLMLTALNNTANRVKGLDTGADDYLIKPFDLSELFARIRALIRRVHGQAREVIELNGVTVNTLARKVFQDQCEVELTAREYGILEYLARRYSHTVSRAELFEHLFDEHDDAYSNVIDVHVSAIRKKLGQQMIKTRRGLGYFVGE
ncbi:response regulator transcription factor [Aestuariibacter sp. GS-14]|uniref:response regulator transcription factor n=1 Tax=Aestuariibacter sp. GS-14 TaxID=2590670 RepID=UPI00112DC1C5|nr:response regulator transcription factor [Aestuariibacter sp. GS-14]TPV57349.1 response regulator transcription factor [Aestuariibacter sp. GS-14]